MEKKAIGMKSISQKECSKVSNRNLKNVTKEQLEKERKALAKEVEELKILSNGQKLVIEKLEEQIDKAEENKVDEKDFVVTEDEMREINRALVSIEELAMRLNNPNESIGDASENRLKLYAECKRAQNVVGKHLDKRLSSVSREFARKFNEMKK